MYRLWAKNSCDKDHTYLVMSLLFPPCSSIFPCYLYASFRCLIHINIFWIIIYFHQYIIYCLISVHNERMGIEPILPSRRITQNSSHCSVDVSFRLSTTVTLDRFRVSFRYSSTWAAVVGISDGLLFI